MRRNEPLLKINEIVRRLERLLQNRAVLPIKKSDDQKSLLDAVNTASNSARNGWIFFVALIAFFFITVSSVEHRDLLMDTPVQLPFLNIGLPLTRFFLFAPLIFLLIHIRLLLQHAMLAHKIRTFEELLNDEEPITDPRSHDLRQQLSTYIYTQMLGGPDRVKLLNIVLQIITVGTLILLPLLLLVWFQIVFLPYHDTMITGWHQAFLVLDAIITGTLGVFACFPNWHFWGGWLRRVSQRFLAQFIPALFILSTTFFSVCVATLPGSWLDQKMLTTDWVMDVPVKPRERYNDIFNPGNKPAPRTAFSLTARMFEGEVSYVTGKTSSWFSRNLILPSLKFYPVRSKDTRIDLRGRDLRYAVLDKADLRYADLTGARLDGASLINADLSHAILKSAAKGRSPAEILNEMGEKRFDVKNENQLNGFIRSLRQKGFVVNILDSLETRADGKHLDKLVVWRLPDKAFEVVTLTDANLTGAILKGADLKLANLNRANLTNANFFGAKLVNVKLIEANLSGAFLINVDLRRANLTGANISNAKIVIANLRGAIMEVADLRNAMIISTDLKHASLALAIMNGSKIIDTDLQGTQLQGALLYKAVIWNSDLSKATLGGANFNSATIWKSKPFNKNDYPHNKIKGIVLEPPDQKLIDKIKKLIDSAGGRVKVKRMHLVLNELLDENKQADWKKTESYAEWTAGIKSLQSLDQKKFREGLATYLGRLACDKLVFAEAILKRLEGYGYGDWSSYNDDGRVDYSTADFSFWNGKIEPWGGLLLPTMRWLASGGLGDYVYVDDFYYGSRFPYSDIDPAPILAKLKSDKCKAAKSLSPKFYSGLEKTIKSYRKRQKKKFEQAPQPKPKQ